MTTPGFIDAWPHTFHPVGSRTVVEVFQLRPDLVDQLRAWSGGQAVFVNGGPAVLLPGGDPLATRLVGLGDFAVHVADMFYAERADGFYQRYQPADPVVSTSGD